MALESVDIKLVLLDCFLKILLELLFSLCEFHALNFQFLVIFKKNPVDSQNQVFYRPDFHIELILKLFNPFQYLYPLF